MIFYVFFFKGYRTSYVPLTRRGFRTPATPRRPQGSRFYVVKRKRNPNSISVNRRNQEEEDNEVDVEPATSSVNYQTTKSFHREATLDSGERHGEYGYIDPIGVRRVVTYSTGSRGGIHKGKENDYVGPNTYFEAFLWSILPQTGQHHERGHHCHIHLL